MINVRYLGHACFQIDTGSCKILIDPFLTGNPCAAAKAEETEADFICVTHGHSDHVGDTEAIARRNDATIISTIDLSGALFPDLKAIPANIGGWISVPFGRVKLTPAIHGSGVPGTLACGFILDIGGTRIYHAGDTALTKDLELLKDENIDLALLPIGDVFTMGPEDAVKAAKMIGAKMNVPMHYKTFPFILQEADPFREACEKEGIPVKVLAPGESLEL